MSEELDVLKDLARRLEEAKIPYMITGSVAGNFYSVPRMTRDIDMVVEIQREDADRIWALFKDGYYVDRESVLEAVEEKGMFNMIHQASVIKIDFIVRKNLPYRQVEFTRRRQIEIEGVKMWIVSPEDLILSKLFWAKDSASELQLGDIRNLLEMVKNLDVAYLEKWVRTLGLEESYQRVKA